MESEAKPGGPGAWLRENGADLANVVCLGALAALVYTLDLDSVGIGGDAIRKWHFVRQWFHGNHFAHARWDHHMARVGVNLVAFFAQLFLGRGPLVYYVPALFAGVVTVMMVYAIGKRFDSRFTGALAAFFLIAFKPAHTATTQLLPEVFSGAYAAIAAYFYVRYSLADRARRMPWLVATGVALFAGYLGKETTVFFIPGFVLAVLWTGGSERWKDVAVLLGILAIGVLLETLVYKIFTDYSHRFAVVTALHVYDPAEDQGKLGSLFDRYEKAEPEWRFVFYAFLPAALAVVAFARNRVATGIVAVALSYFLFLTFAVRSLEPLVVWQAFHSRYLDSGAPFVFLTLALFVKGALTELASGVRPRPLMARLASASKARYALVPVIAAIAAVTTYARARPKLDEHPFRVLPQAAKVLNDAYRRNLPIVSVRNPNGLWAAYSVLLDDRLLTKDGLLPTYDEVKRISNNTTFLVRDGQTYEGDKLRRMQKKHCALEVMGKEGYTYVRPMTPLRPECDAEVKRP